MDNLPKAKFAKCDNCTLKNETFVSSEGLNLESSDFIFVGEAPGRDEVLKKRPFIGQAGQLLNQTLSFLNIERQRCLITNACSCRPESNRTPTFEEIQNCYNRLEYEIKQKQPKVIIALGGTAVQAIFNNKDLKISTVRKTPGIWSDEFKCWIVPTFHPASLLYVPSRFTDYMRDLKKIKSLQNKAQGEMVSLETKVYLLDTLERVFRGIDIIETKDCVAVDIECTGLDWRKDKIIALGFTYKENTAVIIPEKILEYNIVRFRLQKLFRNKNIKFIFQSGQFDTKFLKSQYGFEARVDEDTMLMHYCTDERRGTHNLTDLSMEYLGAKNYEAEFKKTIPRFVGEGKDKRPGNYGDAPKETLYKYLGHDTDYTFKLYKIFKNILDSKNYNTVRERVYKKISIPGTNMLREVEMTGFKVDLEYLGILEKKYKKQIKDLRDDIYHIVEVDLKFSPEQYVKDVGAKSIPKRFNLNSPKQLAYVLQNLAHLPIKRDGVKKGTHRYTLEYIFHDVLKLDVSESRQDCTKFVHYGYRGDQDVYIENRRLKEPKSRLINNIMLYRRHNTIYTKFIVAMIEHAKYDSRIHGSFLLTGTETGRLASSNPNMQNIPRNSEIRRMFIAKKGFRLVEADYSQVELRMLAFLSQDKTLLEIFRAGIDLHTEFAKELFGENFTKEQRDIAKSITFGIPYGRGHKSIAGHFQITDAAALEMMKGWHRKYSGASKWIDEQKEKLKKGIVSETIFGRKRRFGLITDDTRKYTEKQAVNFLMQSNASDLLLLSAIELSSELKSEATLVNLVHDCIIFEVSEDKVMDVALKIKKKMEEIPKRELNPNLSFTATISTGERWGFLKKIDFEKFENERTV